MSADDEVVIDYGDLDTPAERLDNKDEIERDSDDDKMQTRSVDDTI